MPRSRTLLALCSLALALGLLSPRAAVAGVFAQSWAVSAWQYAGEIGYSDFDFQPEILFINNADGHYAIVDEVTGAIEKEFPAFTTSNSSFSTGDLDGDGRNDLIFVSQPDVVPPFFKAYHWNGSDYVTFISHADSVGSYDLESYRTAGHPEIWESSSNDPNYPNGDFRLRNLTGQVLFRASTDVPGWSRPFRQVRWVDRNHDGITEMVLEDQTKIRAYNQYSGSFTVAWTLTGWSSASELGNVDADPQSEFWVTNNADGHYAIADGLTGAIQQEFPGFSSPNAFFLPRDLDGDGRLELIVQQIAFGPPQVLSIYHWNGATLVQSASVTGTDSNSNLAIVQHRSSTQFEIMDLAPTDVLLRDLSGALLFRASTDVPGWSVVPFTLGIESFDPDHNGVPNLILHDDSHVWDIQYNGAFAQVWVANGWQFAQELGNLDADPQAEIMLNSSADGRFAVFDGLTGAKQQEFTDFTRTNSDYQRLDIDADSRDELFFGRLSGQTPLFSAYKWNGSTLAPLYSHTEPTGQWGPVQLRSASQFEFLEVDPPDIRVRDLTGSVLFRASTDLPAWSGGPFVSAGQAVNYPELLGVRGMFVFDATQSRLVLYHNTTAAPPASGATAFHVFQNTPNPFTTTTAFRFSNPRAGQVGVRIFDAGGRLIRTLDQKLPAGVNEIHWDGRDDRGRNAPSGVLFYEVTAGGIRQTRKLIRTQ